jgi:hypothetical protein
MVQHSEREKVMNGQPYSSFALKERAIKLHAKADPFIVTERTKSRYLSVLENRIRMLLGTQDPDPDPLVRGANPDKAPDPSLF